MMSSQLRSVRSGTPGGAEGRPNHISKINYLQDNAAPCVAGMCSILWKSGPPFVGGGVIAPSIATSL